MKEAATVPAILAIGGQRRRSPTEPANELGVERDEQLKMTRVFPGPYPHQPDQQHVSGIRGECFSWMGGGSSTVTGLLLI